MVLWGFSDPLSVTRHVPRRYKVLPRALRPRPTADVLCPPTFFKDHLSARTAQLSEQMSKLYHILANERKWGKF